MSRYFWSHYFSVYPACSTDTLFKQRGDFTFQDEKPSREAQGFCGTKAHLAAPSLNKVLLPDFLLFRFDLRVLLLKKKGKPALQNFPFSLEARPENY